MSMRVATTTRKIEEELKKNWRLIAILVVGDAISTIPAYLLSGWWSVAVTVGFIIFSTIVVTMILVKPTGEILMQLRDDGNGKSIEYPNTWTLPGGGIESGESYLETAVRELKAEFEIELEPDDLKLLWTYTHDAREMTILIVSVSGNVRPVLHEGADIQWMTLGQIKGIQPAFDNDKIIPYIEQYLQNENRRATRLWPLGTHRSGPTRIRPIKIAKGGESGI
jgi:8-oxo-dGTP pyrophosphatase MutT (NUDIX family)